MRDLRALASLLFLLTLLGGNARRFSGQLAQIVELGAPHVAARGHFDPVDARRMDRKGALDADPVRHLAHREGGADAPAALADHDPGEHLHALLLTLDDLDVHTHGVAGLEVGHVALQLLALDRLDRIHWGGTSLMRGNYRRSVLLIVPGATGQE